MISKQNSNKSEEYLVWYWNGLKLTLILLYKNIINIYYISIEHITYWNPSPTMFISISNRIILVPNILHIKIE
jgi:hypothetical protein